MTTPPLFSAEQNQEATDWLITRLEKARKQIDTTIENLKTHQVRGAGRESSGIGLIRSASEGPEDFNLLVFGMDNFFKVEKAFYRQ